MEIGTVFTNAAENGHEAVVRLLLDEGVANVNESTSSGLTAVFFAAFSGHEEMVRLLIERGADFAVKSSSTSNALYIAAHRGHAAVVDLLLQSSSIDVMTRDKFREFILSALNAAAARGHEAVVQSLLERGGEAVTKMRTGITVLREAASRGADGEKFCHPKYATSDVPNFPRTK